MVKPPTSVRSIRLADALWSALQAQADSLGVSLNRYVGMRLEGGVKRDLTSAAKVAAARKVVASPTVGQVVRDALDPPKPEPSSSFTPRADSYPAWMKPTPKGSKK